jgi:myosin heavy subunit
MANVKKTTLAESPEASRVLTDIQPNEVSLVDMPANGEPFVVVKRGGVMPEEIQKLDHKSVPRPVMKAIDGRLKSIMKSVDELSEVVKALPATEDGNNVNAPAPLVAMTKSIAADFRSLQSPESYPVSKRGSAQSVLPVTELIRKQEFIDSVEKQNAISYLMRDEYVNVSTSVTEWLTTYVDGIETDDDGPMLIPSNLNDGVEESASKMEKLAEDYPALDEEEEPDVEAEVSKLNEEIQTLKTKLKSAKDSDEVNKRGSKMAATRLNSLKSVSSGVSEAASQLSEIIKELEDDDEETEEGEPMATETEKNVETPVETEKNVETPASEQPTEIEGVQKNANGESVTNDQLMAALTKFATDSGERMDKLEEKLEATHKMASEASESVEKVYRGRGEARGNDTEGTTKTEKSVEKKASSFNDLLGLPDGM